MTDRLEDAWRRAKEIPPSKWTALQEKWFGCIDLVTDDGWIFTVYIDAGELDYFDSVTSPDGHRLDFDSIWEAQNQRLNNFFDEEVRR